MPSSIQQLDVTTSKSIQASLLFPTLTSIVLELVYQSLNFKSPSFIEVHISLAPEWQIACIYDEVDHQLTSFQQIPGSSLDYLGYLGIVDRQSGQYKRIQKAGNLIFSGYVEDTTSGSERVQSSVTVRDIFRNLPVRRQVLCNASFARSEAEKCRRALSIAILPHYSTRVTMRCTSVEEARSRVILDAAKTTSLLARYENLFSLCVTTPGSSLSISTNERIKQSHIQVKGFVILSLLSTRSRQHILLNGRLQDVEDFGNMPVNLKYAANLQTIVMQILEASFIGANQISTRHHDVENNYSLPGKHFGYFLDVQISKPEQLDQVRMEGLIRRALSDVLQANDLLPIPEVKRLQSRSETQLHESPTKKLRAFTDMSVENARGYQDNCRHFTLNRAGLLREPKKSKNLDHQAGWLHEVLSSWKSTLPTDSPVEERVSSLCDDRRHDAVNGVIMAERGYTLHKAGLARSRIVGQVDAKFISIVYGDDTLVLVDQHAAHERVRLEAILSNYVNDCLNRQSTGPQILRQISIAINLPRHLAQVFRDKETIQSLEIWGFFLKIEQEIDSMIQIKAIPEILSEKLGSDQALKHFIVNLASSLEDENVCRRMKLSPSILAQSSQEGGWIIALRHLPAPLLDLFNSMACRGAIMFNDPLTHQQCSKLIIQLSQTKFPFICAHGRPSISPISYLQLSSTIDVNPPTPFQIHWAALQD